MIPTPVQKSAVELAACRGEAEARPSLFSGAYQPPSRSHCSGQSFGHRCAWKRMTPIGVGRVQQVEQLERQTWDRRVRGLLAPSRWVEMARSPKYVLLLLRVAKGRATMVSQRIRSQRVLFTNGGTWSEDSRLSSLSLRIGNSQGCCSPSFSLSGEVLAESILSAERVKVWVVLFPSCFGVSYRICRRR